MAHTSNIANFLKAANSTESLLQAYCGLVVIELFVKQKVGLVDHNICFGLNKLRVLHAVGPKSWVATYLLSLTDQLRNDIQKMKVNGKDGQPRFAPAESYPYIRYLRFAEDGWIAPHTSTAELLGLADTVNKIRSVLTQNFGLSS